MHLVYVTSALPFSLEETWITPEILELYNRGHRVTLIPIRPGRTIIHGDARLLAESTIAEPLLSLTVLGVALLEILRAPRLALRSVFLVARSRSFNVFLKNLAVFPKGLWLARIAWQQSVDHIHAHFASTNSTVALVASLHSGIPWSFTAHRWDISEDNLLDRKIQAATFVRAIDVRGREELSTFAGDHYDKLRVIHMGVVLPPPSSERVSRREGPLRVLMAARFGRRKGHRYALDAVAQLKRAGVNITLHCAGDGPLKVAIEKYAVELDLLDRVHFPGLLGHQEILSQLREHQWDVALLPSIEISSNFEGIPVFLIEAMAAGVPVVATSTGGIPELLSGGAGLLVPQQDSRAIAEALLTLAADPNLQRQIAEAGLRRVKEQFTIESTVLALLEEISSAHAPKSSTRVEFEAPHTNTTKTIGACTSPPGHDNSAFDN